MARSRFLVAALVLVAACGTLQGSPEAPTDGTPDGGTDAAVSTSDADAADALAPTCGWTPFDDGFERADAWDPDHAPFGPQDHLVVAVDPFDPRSGTKSLKVSITPDTGTRGYSYEHHLTGPGSGCVELRFALKVARTPITKAGSPARAVSVATFELDDSSLLALDLENDGTLLVTEGSAPDGGKVQYAVSSASPPLDAIWRVVTLRYEQLATKNRITLDVDGKTLTHDLTFPHSTVGIVRVGCRFADTDVTATYAIDDVSIR